MKVTIFKSVKSISTPFFVEPNYVFDQIRSGKVKDLVNKIRTESNKDERNKLKLLLPAICFSGEFATRNKAGLTKHSGLICLDFDNFKSISQLNEYRNTIQASEYTYACFLSPSGNGLKVIIKIPECNSDDHVYYFVSLSDFFNIEYLDAAAKDVARVCYASYDPDIYVNDNALLWDKKDVQEHKQYSISPPILRITNTNKIIDNLHKWMVKKYGIIDGKRNNNMYIFAAALNDFGIPQAEAEMFCHQYQQDDFNTKEIDRIIQSAYGKRDQFGSKYFDDNDTIDYIKRLTNKGINKDQIKERLKDKIKDNTGVEEAIDNIGDSVYTDNFWDKTTKGKVIISNNKFKRWLNEHGFNKYYPDNTDSFIYVYKENNLIDITNESRIKDYVMNFLESLEDISIFEEFASKTNLFSDKYLNIMQNINISFKEDTKDKAYIYFNNCAVEVSANGINKIDYIDLDGFIWKKHIINSNFEKIDYKGCDFAKFIYNISGQNYDKELSIKTTIGYLLHSYKNSASNFAVILNDETISENPNGGTGKGIIINAINKIKRCAVIDGKTFSFDKSFPYQTVSSDTQIIVFDDVRKNFNFENLFSIVTEGITLERKNKDAIKIPIDKSPKVLISTNYAIGGDGASFDRRKWDVELAQHYNVQNTPLTEFGRLLFDQWDESEWLKFYNYMLECLILYLKHGIVKTDFKNTKLRAFIASTCSEFNEWMQEGHIQLNYRYVKKDVYDNFIKEYPDRKMIHQKTFNKWIKTYANFNRYIYKDGVSNGSRWFEIKENENSEVIINEVDNEETPF